MTLRVRVAACVAFAGFVLAGVRPSAQTVPAGQETSAESVASYGLPQLMPVDPEVVVGTLPNGLKYYVRANGKPGRRAELRLVVKAGSVLEDDDQQGLAHFVEHMEFEGSRHFPGQSISDFLSELGLSIGPDANAATSYDDTQYTLRVPTDVPGVLDRAMLVLEDWAQGATFEQTRHRARARHRALRVAHASRSGRADPGQDSPGPARRVAVRGSSADRQARDHRTRSARAADAVLQGLVPSRPDGRDCRRRYRSRRGRGDDQGSFLGAVFTIAEASAPGVRHPRTSSHALHDCQRPRNDGDVGAAQRPPPGTRSGIGRRISRADDRPAVCQHARRQAWRTDPERKSGVPARGGGSAVCSRPPGPGTRRSSRRSSRTTA